MDYDFIIFILIIWILEYNTEIIFLLMIRPLVQLRGLARSSHWTRRSLCYEDRMNLSRILSGIVSIVNLQSFSIVLCSEIRLEIIRRSTIVISTRSELIGWLNWPCKFGFWKWLWLSCRRQKEWKVDGVTASLEHALLFQ